MSSRKTWLIVKVANEGYCCPNAYLRLCAARGESVKDMARNIGISPDALWYHYRKLRANNAASPVCQRFLDCMDTVVKEIENDK
jgi:hypothetical protein